LGHQAEPVVARVEPGLARGLRLGEPVVLEVDAARVLAFDEAGRRIGLQVLRHTPASRPDSDRAVANG
jgi:hypothetical protein